jgi:cobalt-zinc-cadmium efflux system membrane fusion protein
MNKYTLIKPIVLALCISFLQACKSAVEADANREEADNSFVELNAAQLKNATLKLGEVQKKSLSSHLKVNGLIDVPPQNLVSVSVPLGGFLKSTKLLPGMHIAKGEIIAIMEDQQYIDLQQEYLTTDVKLRYATLEYQRQKDLNQSKASSDKIFQQAETEYKNLKIALKALNEKLALIGVNSAQLNETNLSRSISIHSPIDGYVSAVHVNIGKYVNPTEVLFELVNPEDIHLALTIFESDLDKLFIGQKLLAYSNANPQKKYPCEIILIGKDLSNERSVEVHCHFEQLDKKLIPGMFMNAELEVNNLEAFALPEEAVVDFEGKQFVFIAGKSNQFKLEEVKIGAGDKGFLEIKNGEQFQAKKVVIKGAYTLLMKLKNKSDEE